MPHISEIEKWTSSIERKVNDHYGTGRKDREWIKFEVSYGAKNAKIIRSDRGQRSVYCFVDRETGDILKAASWRAPAKHARGNIKDPDGGWGTAVGPYGAAYLKGPSYV